MLTERDERAFCMSGFRMMSVASLETSPLKVTGAAAAENDRWTACVSVIVPVYNESSHVEELLQAIHAAPVKKEIIIVDDGSTDGTRQKLQAMPLAEDVTVVFHEKNCGKGAGIRTAQAPPPGGANFITVVALPYNTP